LVIDNPVTRRAKPSSRAIGRGEIISGKENCKRRGRLFLTAWLYWHRGCSKSRDEAHARQVAEQVRTEFLHAWNNYERYAWGHDAFGLEQDASRLVRDNRFR